MGFRLTAAGEDIENLRILDTARETRDRIQEILPVDLV